MRAFLESSPVIPVIEIDDPGHARPLGNALLSGGIGIAEITLRTPRALEAIAEMATLSGMVVGAGTLLNGQDVRAASESGAAFGVSPGTTPDLIDAVREVGLPFLPGAATPTEVAHLQAQGFGYQKFFPAEAAGGTEMLKALSGPFQDIIFCPTGGVSPDNASDYLSLRNVLCVGGSWVAPRHLIAEGNWSQIEDNARTARSICAD